MKYLEKEKSQKFEHGAITAYEYPLGDPDINCALVELKGRHPDQCWLINEKCKEMVFVVRGLVQLTTENETVSLKEGDIVLINPLEKYFWNGDCTLLTPCTPAWTPEQNKIIE